MNDGFSHITMGLDAEAQHRLMAEVAGIIRQAPLFQPVMPKTGRPFSVQMTNAGPLGWVSDRQGYRYQRDHPETGRRWPAMPKDLLDLWAEICGATAPEPECCLINHYATAKARMGLHLDKDEQTFELPVVSISLGDSAVFRIGGPARRAPTRSLELKSGDVVVMAGKSRLFYHGIDRIQPGTSGLVPGGGRINLTLRRVNAAETGGT
jgi:alkylated DNA repair protein (DNA oxidative demethylase)